MLLQATDLKIKYGTKNILDNTNLYIEEKEKIGVVGLNGHGKSTLLKIFHICQFWKYIQAHY